MKRARMINAIIWIAIAVTICVMVTKQWYYQGCEIKSLVIACTMYTAMIAAVGGTIDATIKEREMTINWDTMRDAFISAPSKYNAYRDTYWCNALYEEQVVYIEYCCQEDDYTIVDMNSSDEDLEEAINEAYEETMSYDYINKLLH